MFSRLQLAKKYLHYYLTASNGKGHGVHSPFVFDFIKNVLNDKKPYKEYDRIESLRQKLLTDETFLEIKDFGAGSKTSRKNKRQVKYIARTSLKSKKYAQLLFRIVKYYNAQKVIELGTSLGITTSYMAANASNVFTFEGSQAIADKATENIKTLGIDNTKIIIGDFAKTLGDFLPKNTPADLIFIDGNHRLLPTLEYFSAFLSHSTSNAIFIFDDIHWSSEMEIAWKKIKDHPSVTLTIDLFFIGIVLIRKDFKVKQHFCIRF